MKNIEQLKKKDLNCNIFSVYDYDGLTITELLCQFFTKINECIDTSNETIKLAEWLVNEGLEIEVAKKLVMWLEDGTLENIINVNLFNSLNEKINGLSSQLEHNTNRFDSVEINLMYPPKPFEGVVNGEDISTKLLNIINEFGSNRKYILPYGKYKVSSSIELNNLNNVIIHGSNSTIQIQGTSTSMFKLTGTIDNIEICNFNVIGDGLVDSRHMFISTPSGQFISNLNIHDNKINDVVVGMSLNADMAGYIINSRVYNNILNNIVGTNAGQGYGIHVTNHDYYKYANISIYNNEISNVQRHSIYLARGNGYKVYDNTIINHRIRQSTSSVLPAIQCSRTCNILVKNNTLINSLHADIGIYGGEADSVYVAKNINVTSNQIINTNNFYSIVLEHIASDSTDVKNINIENNIFDNANENVGGIYIGNAINTRIINNGGSIKGVFVALGFLNESDNTAIHNDNIKIINNDISGVSGAFIRIGKNSLSSVHVASNDFTGYTSIFSSPVNISNPNLYCENQKGQIGVYFTNGVKLKTKEQSSIASDTLKINNFRWSTTPLILGDYYLWCTTSGILRIKKGIPTSELDGEVVGSQS